MNFIVDENGKIFVEVSKGIYTPEKENEKTKIIEQDNKIEKLKIWYDIESINDFDYANYNFESFYKKINEIIDYINKK